MAPVVGRNRSTGNCPLKLRVLSIILVALVLILSSTLITEFLPDWRWTHHPFHAVIEGLGAFIAIVVATMILSLLHYGRLSPTYVWVASALAGMGILDGFHAGTHAGQEFVWLHSIATLIGGVIFALVWIPDRITESLRVKTLPLFIGAAATVFALFSVTFPDALPVMTTEAGFTLAAQFANILGGLCFLVASSFFFFRKRGQITNENIILSNHTFLFGISAIIFEFSVLWDGPWWLWHSLRLIAYLVVLYYFLYLFNLTQATISRETKALKESEARLRSLAANLPGAVFQRKLTPEGRHAYTYISPRVRDLYGLEPQDIVADASVLLDAMPVEDRDRWMAASKHSASTLSPMDLEVRMIAADGATCWIHTISRPTRDENGEVVWDGVDIDITEQKRAQSQLIQASKLSTLGEMATGIAHELNQPLSVIGMAAERAMDEFEGGDVDLEFISERLKQVIAQTERAAAIIDHMRMFGRQEGAEAPSEIDPRPAIEGALDTIGEQLRVLNIEVTTDLPRTCPPVLGHEVQLEQVILNLLSNARDAIEARSAPAGRKDQRRGAIRLKVEVSESGKEIKIVVRDTGGGIPEAVMDRVFDPFFTTKEEGKGTGLGLSISYGIITDMGGRIEATNVEGGAEFTITLPVAEADKGA